MYPGTVELSPSSYGNSPDYDMLFSGWENELLIQGGNKEEEEGGRSPSPEC
jgi:hypothetical protein